MQLYNILVKKNEEDKIVDIVAIGEGFVWMAFFFSLPWFLFHKMWRNLFLLLLLELFFVALKASGIFLAEITIMLEAMVLIVIAFNANCLLEKHLCQAKYQSLKHVLANNENEAKALALQDFELEDIVWAFFDRQDYIPNKL